MSVVKIGISLPNSLLEQVDTLARRNGQSRSEFIRRSLERTLMDGVAPGMLAEAHALYAAIGTDERALAEDFLTVSADTLPPYEEGDF